jgi:hypothetical protein
MIEISALIAETLGSSSIAIAVVSLLSTTYLAKKLTQKQTLN